jgi:hypothetical protein
MESGIERSLFQQELSFGSLPNPVEYVEPVHSPDAAQCTEGEDLNGSRQKRKG